jgi:hypothetical protein
MPIVYKTFTKLIEKPTLGLKVEQEPITLAIEALDKETNDFYQKLHWSQARDSMQAFSNLPNGDILVSRTVVYTTEQLATGINRPPV